MRITRKTSDALAKRLAAIPDEIRVKLRPALLKGAEEVADTARQLAEVSQRSGESIESIEVTGPGETTPAYAQGGETLTTREIQAMVTVGNEDVRSAHLVEFGPQERQHKDR